MGANLKLTASIVTAIGGVRIPGAGTPQPQPVWNRGARNFTDKISITLQAPVSGFSLSTSKTEDWVDPVAGIYAHYRIDDKWFVNAEGDGGGVYNSATAQGLGAVGYNWTQNIASTLGYRVLYTYDKETNANGSYRLLQWMYGPFAAIKYTF